MATSSDDGPTNAVARVVHDFRTQDSVSTTVATALGRAANADPTALPPLYYYVDPDALDALVRHGDDCDRATELQVGFTVDDYDVHVRSDGVVSVYERY